MNPEKPKQYTPEEIAEMEKNRTISDANLLRNEAKYVVNEGGEKVLQVEKESADMIRKDFEESEKYHTIERLKKGELESLGGDEKEFAEFIKRRNEFQKDIKPLLDMVRSGMISPEVRKKIFNGLRFLGSTAYKKFYSGVNDDRRVRIENSLIQKHRSEMSPAEKAEAELEEQLNSCQYKNKLGKFKNFLPLDQ